LSATLSGRSHRPCALVEFTCMGTTRSRPIHSLPVLKEIGPQSQRRRCSRALQTTSEHRTACYTESRDRAQREGGSGPLEVNHVVPRKGWWATGHPCWAALYRRSRASPVNSGPSLAVHCRSTCSVTSRERAKRESKLENSPRSLGRVQCHEEVVLTEFFTLYVVFLKSM